MTTRVPREPHVVPVWIAPDQWAIACSACGATVPDGVWLAHVAVHVRRNQLAAAEADERRLRIKAVALSETQQGTR